LDQHSIGEENQPARSPRGASNRPTEDAKPSRPFAFPNLRRVRQLGEARDGSPRPEGSSDMATLNLAQEVDLSNKSPDGCLVPYAKSQGTPLPPNPFELSTTGNVRTDVFKLVPLADIITKNRLRGVVEALVPIMTDSVSEHDVIQPPVVRPDPAGGGKFILVSGLQRVNAATVLGMQMMLCRVVELNELEAVLWEVDENLVRATLSPADEALFMDRRREVYELLHGKAKAKGAAAANAAMGRRHAPALTRSPTSSIRGRSHKTALMEGLQNDVIMKGPACRRRRLNRSRLAMSDCQSMLNQIRQKLLPSGSGAAICRLSSEIKRQLETNTRRFSQPPQFEMICHPVKNIVIRQPHPDKRHCKACKLGNWNVDMRTDVRLTGPIVYEPRRA
jgi:ParB-like nuclease domain